MSKYSLSSEDDDCMQQFKTEMWELGIGIQGLNFLI